MDQANIVNLLLGDATKYEDDMVAMILQEDFEEQKKRVKEDEMRSTHCGRAYLFVETVDHLVLDLLGEFWSESDDTSMISLVALDGMVPLAERMMAAQENFRKAGKPHFVDVAYHYTAKQCMARIQIDGLMTKNERQDNHIEVAIEHGCAFGDGVYTADNPFSFQQYGDVGLLVARLQGSTQQYEQQQLLPQSSFDTIIGNKETRPTVYMGTHHDCDEVVLTDSAQCLALVQFPSSLIPKSARTIYKLQVEMQKLVDVFFNGKGEIYLSPKTQVTHQLQASFSLESSRLECNPIEGINAGADALYPQGTTSTKTQGLVSFSAWDPDLRKYKRLYQDIMRLLLQTDPDNAPKSVRIFQQSICQWNKGLDHRYEPLLNITIDRLKQLPEMNRWRTLIESLIENELASSVMYTDQELVPVATSLTLPVATSVSSLSFPEQIWDQSNSDARISPLYFLSSDHDPPPPPSNTEQWTYEAPEALECVETPFCSWILSATDIIQCNDAACCNHGNCPICREPLRSVDQFVNHQESGDLAMARSSPICRLKVCRHEFHTSCLKDAVRRTAAKCPSCHAFLGEPQGVSPSGTMTMHRMNLPLYVTPMAINRHPTIQITYHLTGGIQKQYHENTGAAYPAASLIAYLPDSPEGNQLLKRLVYAFQHGLTFRVGTCMAVDQSNHCNITWASIPHKTTRQGGGAHSWPDPFYFKNCNEELDTLGVPRAL